MTQLTSIYFSPLRSNDYMPIQLPSYDVSERVLVKSEELKKKNRKTLRAVQRMYDSLLFIFMMRLDKL